MAAPVYLPSYVLAGSVAIVAAILLGIRRAWIMAGCRRQSTASSQSTGRLS